MSGEHLIVDSESVYDMSFTAQKYPKVAAMESSIYKFWETPVHLTFDTVLLRSASDPRRMFVYALIAHARLKKDGKAVLLLDPKDRDVAIEQCSRIFDLHESNGIYTLTPKSFKKFVVFQFLWMYTPWQLHGSLLTYFFNKGYFVRCVHGVVTDSSKLDFMRGASHVFVWDSIHWSGCRIHELATHMGIEASYLDYATSSNNPVENKYFYIDRTGMKGLSSLATDDLEWVTDEHMDALERYRAECDLGYAWSQKNEYILCPLESEMHKITSDLSSNQELITHVEAKFPNKNIVFKMHPGLTEDPTQYKLGPNSRVVGCEFPFVHWAQDAELVYGIQSKALSESVLIGTPTIALGGLLKKHQHQQEKLMAAFVDRLIPFDEPNLDGAMAKIGLHFP